MTDTFLDYPTIVAYCNELTPWPRNYNTHPAAQLTELGDSLTTFRQFKPIIVWRCEQDYQFETGENLHIGLLYIIGGHGLWQSAMRVGVDRLEAKDISGVSIDIAEAILLADNAAPLGSEPDTKRLEQLLARAREVVADKPGLAAMMERLRERAGIVASGGNGNGQEQPAEIEAEKHHKKWQAKNGDVWELGPHTIACLDSLDEENIHRVVGDSAVTFVFADPPYGINIVATNVSVGGGEAYDIPFGGVKNKGYVGGGARIKARTGLYPIQTWNKNRIDKGLGSSDGAKPFGSKNKRVSGSDGAANLIDVGKYYPVAGDSTTETAKQSASLLLSLYPDACHIWWGGNYYTDILSPSPCWVVWDKDNTGNFADCEMAWTNQPSAARIFEHRWNGMLKASEQGQRRIHPTQKPIALARYCFEQYGKAGDVIIDPFLGSGISVLAATELGDRRVIGFELEPVYISVVLQRWVDLTGLTPQLVSG